MRRNMYIFTLFSKFAIKSALLHPLGAVLFTFGKLIRFVLFFLFVYFLVSKTSTLKGYTADQAIVFYLTFNVIDTASQLLFREVYRFRQLVVSGELDGVLVKPYHPFLRVLVGGIDPMDSLMLILYIVLTFVYVSKMADSITLASFVTYCILLINALLIGTAFHIAVLAFGIITTNIDHGVMIYRDLTSIGRFPVEIYQEPFRWIVTFIIPIGIMMSYPTQSLFGNLSNSLVITSIAISIFALFLSMKLWGHALKKYQSWGG